jgi:DNA-binding response OmpR family regulator
MKTLGAAETAVLAVLREADGRVVSRREIARRAGLQEASPRRADAIVVQLRRSLGEGAIRTVRSRGWALDPGHG